VTASSTGDDGFAPSDALGRMLEASTSVLEAVEDILITSKLLVDHKEVAFTNMLYNENDKSASDSDLANLQKRTQSLSFLESGSKQNMQSRNPMSRYSQESQSNLEVSVYNSQRNSSHSHGSAISSTRSGFEESPLDSASSTKLSQFFGEDVAPASKQSDSSGRPWFLRKENSNDISFNMEGAVNGGTLPALVERLTIHDQPVDPAFASAFMMTFRLFSNPKQFFKELLHRYKLNPPAGMSAEEHAAWNDKKLNPIQIRVANTLKIWLEGHWVDNEDDCVLEDIKRFASEALMKSLPNIGQRILEISSRKLSSDMSKNGINTPRVKRLVRQEDFPPPILPKNMKRFTILEIDPLETARQLTIVEMDIFCRIQPLELMKQEWSRKNTASVAHNVRAMTTMSTKLTGWVISSILSEADGKRRAFILKYFIKVGERCLTLNNYNTLIAIQVAFNSSTISRMKKTWECLSTKTRQTFEVLKKATDHSRNYANYRNNLKKLNLPCLPFLGLYLTDLTFTDDGNQDMRGKLINFDKYARTARIISDLSRYQVQYPLQEVREIQDFLLISIKERGGHDAQELYEVSLRLEPRNDRISQSSAGPEDVNRELESKIEMLQKAGML